MLVFLGSSERAKVEQTGYDAIQPSRAKRSPQRSRNEPQAGISNAVVSCINREVKKTTSATRTSINKKFSEQNSGYELAL